MTEYEPEVYEAVAEQFDTGDVYASTSETLLITDIDIIPSEQTGTITYVPLSHPTEEYSETMPAVEFEGEVIHSGDYVHVDQSVLHRASDVLGEYIQHNLSIDANRLGVSHPHSAASTVGDIVAASLIAQCTHEWPPAILDSETE